MTQLHFQTKEDFYRYIGKHVIKNLGYGKEGCVFLLNNGIVIKRFYQEYEYDYVMQFQNIASNSFVFPKEAIVIDDSVHGIIMDYIKGDTLQERVPLEQDFLLLGNQLQTLTDDIENISKQGVLVKDFFSGNIIYDNQKFHIIDTLPYLYLPGYNYTKDNLLEIMNRIYDSLLRDISYQKKFPSQFAYRGKMHFLRNPEEYFYLLKNSLEKITHQEINSLGDAKKSIGKKIKPILFYLLISSFNCLVISLIMS